MKNLVLFFAMGLFLGGCATISFAPSKPGMPKADVIATPDQVEVYRTEKPKDSYEEIGAVHFPHYGKLESIVEKMKVEASRQGGNAIIDLQVNTVGAVGTIVRIRK